ncbi:unnamed protein product [Ilex paraguariensis]|uniref:KIB1-4 beta-propeller domain-containing protein n=1 Tax=Ilex paraguariensis TaxID=185542 RepID=A0ABC8U550_9AQUA
MLMISPTDDNGKEKQRFYSVTDGVIHDLQLPMPYNRRCFGSSHGWLFSIEKSMIVTLLNPFNGRSIHLPEFKDPLNDYQDWVKAGNHEYFLHKGILTSDPSQDANNYEVVVIYGGMRRLASFKSSDEAWTFVELKKDYVFSDLIYYTGQRYAVNNRDGLIHVDVTKARMENSNEIENMENEMEKQRENETETESENKKEDEEGGQNEEEDEERGQNEEEEEIENEEQEEEESKSEEGEEEEEVEVEEEENEHGHPLDFNRH